MKTKEDKIAALERELAATKQELIKNQQYYENILSEMPGNIFWKDKDGVDLHVLAHHGVHPR